ncbi:type II toxin-antitoxin system RelE/ParE family toxin [Pusillimonas sp.]|uniref:type II toxin-antitoxin system RelE/ParE family toxin n=1 Tax=Pusillimonas sp. TaxID=3040095 RepID=UPI0029A837E7|nr:type II toxin-antitoxin system RelE/ParE family toxin [Pusillimonas sp.]MDX3894609.1 type II toxin-antitoxin system RelE/ParE family toxin [Pusillimonas sp.]
MKSYHTQWYSSTTRIFRTRTFGHWMRQSDITVDALRKAVSEMAHGLIDAGLGGYLVKKQERASQY